MFKRKPKTQDKTNTSVPVERKKRNWLKISVFANLATLVIVVIGSGSAVVIHQSDTDPNFCASCHLMQAHVTSYFTSGNLDNVHEKAGVMCKDCHDYPVSAEIKGAVDYVTNNYVVDANGELEKRDFGDEICTQCHISREYMERQTDFLYYNPHFTRMGIFTCSTCHLSHGEQIDYCSNCHPNPGQRMLGDTTPRSHPLGENFRVPGAQTGF